MSEPDAERIDVAVQREAELEVRGEPRGLHRVPGLGQFSEDVVEVERDHRRQQEAVVQFRAPPRKPRGVRRAPEPRDQRAQQQLLRQAHLPVRRHLERAHLEQAQSTARPVRRIQLVDAELRAMRVARHVDQHVAQRPVDEPRRRRRSALAASAQFGERDFQFVDLVVARLVHARCLAGRADEQPREQVRQRRMVVPVRDQAAEQVRPPEERGVLRTRAAQHDVVAAAGARVASVEHELLGRQARQARRLVQRFGVVEQFVPVGRRVDVHFDDARVRRDLQHPQARIARRRIAFEHDGQPEFGRRRLDGRHQLEIVLERRERRHEHVQEAARAAGAIRRRGRWRDADRGLRHRAPCAGSGRPTPRARAATSTSCPPGARTPRGRSRVRRRAAPPVRMPPLRAPRPAARTPPAVRRRRLRRSRRPPRGGRSPRGCPHAAAMGHAARTDRLRRTPAARACPPTAARRAAAGSPSASRPGSGTSAHPAETTAR